MTDLSSTARNFNWLVDNFVDTTVGVTDAVAVSSDGLLIARSSSLPRAGAEQVAAIVTGLVSLAQGASRAFQFDEMQQVIVTMQGGYLLVSSIAEGSSLGVVAEAGCDVGVVGYQTTLLVERAGDILTPELVTELHASVIG
jgi:predicted regulator of Ras-like GTPase activity (Roadblock/LC7/MglB family)